MSVLLIGTVFARGGRASQIRPMTAHFSKATIFSDSQQKLSDDVISFRGNAHILLDESVYVTADAVIVSMSTKVCTVTADEESFIKIEQDQITILARTCTIHLDTGLGSASDLRIHSPDAAASAEHGFRRADGTWVLRDVYYTPCQDDNPHWQFKMGSAVLKKNKKITLQGAFFCVGKTPVLPLPVYSISLHKGKPQSGFLMPSFYFDERHGFGAKLGYYVPIARHFDTTVGAYLTSKKGFVLSDEVRWATSHDQFATFSATYAKEWDVLQEFDNAIASKKTYYYLVQGDYYDLFSLGTNTVRSIFHVDVGSDKRFGYRFFNDVGGLDSTFINQWITRGYGANRLIELSCTSDQTKRDQIFTPITDTEIIKETSVRSHLYRVPHVQLNSIFYRLWRNVYYRDDIFFDYVSLKEYVTDSFFEYSLKVKSNTRAHVAGNTTRFGYRGNISTVVPLKRHTLRVAVYPELQTRGRLYHYDARAEFGNAHARPHIQGEIEWNFPTARGQWEDNFVFAQVSILGIIEPKTYQNDWLYVDRYDRWYQAKNLLVTARGTWMNEAYLGVASISTGVTGAEHQNLFALERDPSPGFQLPLTLTCDIAGQRLGCSMRSEFSWNRNSNVLTMFEGHVWAQLGASRVTVDYLYIPRKTAQDRTYLTDITHFFKTSLVLKVGEKINIEYDGNFFLSHQDRTCADLLKPLSHRAAISYIFDCWRVMFGFEERRYKDFGQWRADHAFVFSIRLDTLGSCVQRFKRPGSLFDSPDYT